MKNKLSISRLSSLNFNQNWKHPFEVQEEYRQIFSRDDVIRVQYEVDSFLSVIVKLYSSSSETIITPTLILDDEVKHFEFYLSGLNIDCYRVELVRSFEGNEIPFAYCDFKIIEDLSNTVLLRYTNYIDSYNTWFSAGEESNKFFDFRIEGGFLYSENVFQSDNENFRDQSFSLHNLSSFPYESNTLTLGTAEGVPDWVGRKANMIFSCSDVYVNGFRCERADGSETTREVIREKYPLYIFKIEIEPDDFYNDNLNMIEGINNIVLGTEDDNIVTTEDDINLIRIL